MRRALLLLLLIALPVHAQDVKPVAPVVTFPDVAHVAPASPTVPVKLGSGQLYVFRASVPCIVLTSPEGLVRVSQPVAVKPAQYVDGDGAYQIKAEVSVKLATPLELKARFVDGDGSVQVKAFPDKHVWCVEAVATGRVELIVVVDGGKEIVRRIIDSNTGPIPPPPDPPTPPDPPKPPDPKPDPPTPAPIPLAGLRVLIVHEEMEPEKLTAGQRATMYGAPMRDWLDAKCIIGPDGKTREYRIWDQHVPLGGAPKHWRDAMQRKPASIPWLIVSNGRTGYEGPLPATMDETKKIISKHAE